MIEYVRVSFNTSICTEGDEDISSNSDIDKPSLCLLLIPKMHNAIYTSP